MKQLGLLALAIGCAKQRVVPEMTGSTRAEVQGESSAAGVVDDGQFRDLQHQWELAIPEGWIARPGQAASPLRVTLEQVGVGTRLEVWAYEGSDLTPRRREHCLWTYVDTGHFAVLPVTLGPVQAATCVPEEPRSDRLFAYMVVWGGVSHHFEIHVPTDALVDGKASGEAAIRGMSWAAIPSDEER